ncbi:MAG: Do family serine endopeptidase [Proteobacteria bacterium]|nr:Do family serine endopeptidase [Pseudomonadota bacterium]
MKFIKNVKKTQTKKTFIMVLFLAVGLIMISSFYPKVEAGIGNAAAMPESFSTLAEMASPAVVNIRTVKTLKGGGRVFRHFKSPFGNDDPMQDFFKKFFGDEHPRDFKQRSLGSGFIIEKEGYIVTNNHVIENADKIEVLLKNEKEYDAEIIGRDVNTDLALIKIKPERDLPVLKLGDSDALKVGQWVMAIGNPFGLEHTVTAGIVSAKGRVIGSGPYDDFIQTDASINPGNSGGPLLNMQGEVVGINTAIIASGQGIGFAIPTKLVRPIINQLKTQGEVVRGWLGVAIQDLSAEVAEYYGIKEKKGVLVTEVFPGDPADKAGIIPEDIILAVNDTTIATSRDLTRTIAEFSVGDVVKITVLRGNSTKTFNAKIAKREDAKLLTDKGPKKDQDQLGFKVANITPDLAQRFNTQANEGVLVVDIASGSKAEEAGLNIGDVIKEVNHLTIKSVDELNRIIGDIKDGGAVNMFVRRANRGFLVVKMTK